MNDIPDFFWLRSELLKSPERHSNSSYLGPFPKPLRSPRAQCPRSMRYARNLERRRKNWARDATMNSRKKNLITIMMRALRECFHPSTTCYPHSRSLRSLDQDCSVETRKCAFSSHVFEEGASRGLEEWYNICERASVVVVITCRRTRSSMKYDRCMNMKNVSAILGTFAPY